MKYKYLILALTFMLMTFAQSRSILVFDPNNENADFVDSLNLTIPGVINIDYQAVLPSMLQNYDAIFFFPGADFNTAHVINKEEGDLLFDYIVAGGKFYSTRIETQNPNGTDLWNKLGVEDIVALTVVTRVDSIKGVDTSFAKDVVYRESFFYPSVPSIIGNYEPVLHAHCTPFDFEVVSISKNDSFKVMLEFLDFIKRTDFLLRVSDYWNLQPLLSVEDPSLPKDFRLDQNYPNPFNPTTKIKFVIPSGVEGLNTIKVYDLLGSEVATLVNKPLAPGTYEVEFNASNLSSGVYFYSLTSGNFTATKKLILLK